MTYDATGSAGSATDDQSATAQVKERATEIAGQAQEKARDVVGSQVDQHSEEAADKVESVADDARAVSESLSDRGQDAAARIVEQGADYAQQLSEYLRTSSSDQILEDVAQFARRQPWVVAAGGLLLGFAASRVLRASAVSTSTSGRSTSAQGFGSARPAGTYAAPSPRPMPAPLTTSTPDLLAAPAGEPYATSTAGFAPEASSVERR